MMSVRKNKIALVTQRYGGEVLGGAEALCRQLAELCSMHCKVEVLTTCARDYTIWENYYKHGSSELNGVKVRRFRVDETRNLEHFNRLDRLVVRKPHTLDDEHSWMRLQGPLCSHLANYVSNNHRKYDAILFCGYLYATTFFNLPVVADKAWLLPFAHDEPSIYLRIFEKIFSAPQGLIFMTPEEEEFCQRRFGFPLPQSMIGGMGVQIEKPEPEKTKNQIAQFRGKHNITGDYVLYAGRIDQSKNVDVLLRDFLWMKDRFGGDLKLLLAGRSLIDIPQHKDIIALGYISEEDKQAAMAGALCFVLPSNYESLSIVLLESWARQRPVLVNAESEVALGQTRRAQGGAWYSNRMEMASALQHLQSNQQQANQLGRQGFDFVREQYNPEQVCQQLLEFIGMWKSVSR